MEIWFKNQIKIIILITINIVDYYLNNNKNNYINIKYIIKNIESIYNSSQNKPINPNNTLIKKEEENIYKFLSKYQQRNITHIDSIFLAQKFRFGNQIILITKIIFYCEIIGCKRIILDKEWNWFIKNRIVDDKYNIIIDVGEINDFINSKTLIDYSDNFFFYLGYIKPELRTDIIKKELLNNIPKIISNRNDLYIYIRSGDIFIKPNKYYTQPPLCFYETILNNYKFNKIYIISEDNKNPIIDVLLNNYHNIIYNTNSLELDIAYLINAYNIVGAMSTFINILLRFNDNLEKYWEYNIYTLKSNIIHFHHSCYNFKKKFTLFLMEPSTLYKKMMIPWKNSEKQKRLMLKEKCHQTFNSF